MVLFSEMNPGHTGVPATVVPASEGALRRRYEAYCRRQSLRLLSLIPREAIRPLYREAREEALAGSAPGESVGDPLEVLLGFCGRLLPLPPFAEWLQDTQAHPAAHLDDEGLAFDSPRSGGPVTVEVRPLDARGAQWYAALDVRADGGVWRGRITFRSREGGTTHRTGDVFSEPEAESVRSRFLEFDDPTLEAFLRSSLP